MRKDLLACIPLALALAAATPAAAEEVNPGGGPGIQARHAQGDAHEGRPDDGQGQDRWGHEEGRHEDRPVVGLGVTLGREVGLVGEPFTPLGATTFLVPINVTRGFRIEPEVGFFRLSSKTNLDDQSFLSFQVGTGVYGLFRHGEALQFYFGARLGFIFSREENEEPAIEYGVTQAVDGSISTTVTRKAMYFGAVTGAEYFLTHRLSLGGEVQLNYTAVFPGDVDVHGMPPSTNVSIVTDDNGGSVLNTRGLVVLRWYF